MLAALVLLACHEQPGDLGGLPSPDDSSPPEITDSDTDLPKTGDDSDTTDSVPKDTGEIPVITGKTSVRSNPANPFSAFVTVTLDLDSTVEVAYGEAGNLDHTTPPVDVVAGVATDILVLGLHASRKYDLRVDATHGLAKWSSDPLAYTTADLETGWPTCTPTFIVDEKEFDPDEVFCTQGTLANGDDIYYCVDHWGDPVFSMRTAASDSLMSMEPLMDGSWASTSYNNSKVIFLDRAGDTIASLPASAFSADTRFEHQYIDSHEIYQIREGKWRGDVVFITDSYETVGKDYKMGNGIIVIDPVTYDVVYDYSFLGPLDDGVSNDPFLPFDRAGYGDYSQDWLHSNAVLHGIDPDGREYFLISMKAQDWIVKLYPDKDELAWALGFDGDFKLVDDLDAKSPVELGAYDWEFHQHGMRFLDNEGPRLDLVMLDNGYPRQDENGPNWNLRYSRFIELEVDQDSRQAAMPFAYGKRYGVDQMFSSTCGNALLLPDKQRMVGLMGETDTMIEVSYPAGERRWWMQCESMDWCAYQVHWFPDMYDTTWIYE